ncbi:MAG: hypothetical protein IPP93_06615 [Chitinophagaceae bacterium]|nr:hypothetical protein [Chitinophagaceae bacterium]
MKKILAGCLLLFACFQKGVSQNVGIGTNSPHASAQLDVSSTSKGVLLPRMTTARMRLQDLNPVCWF